MTTSADSRGRASRRWGGPVSALLIIVEIVVAAAVAHATSWGLTILLLIGLSLVGAVLLPRQLVTGMRTLRRAGREGRPVDTALADIALRVIGTVLLVVPGFVTAAAGLLCLMPGSRTALRRATMPWLTRRLHRQPAQSGPLGPLGPRTPRHHDDTIIDGQLADPQPPVR